MVTTSAALWRAARPRQWTKNLLVLTAPLAAGELRQSWLEMLAAFVVFTLAAVCCYLLNDVADITEDRRHPHKRHRPVAAGELSVATAVAASLLAGLAAVGLAVVVSRDLATVIIVYLAVQAAYTTWLKHQPVLDLAIVSSGFLLRAIAGGVAAAVPLSQWFLLVAAFGSLFMVAGKRYSELRSLGQHAGTRRTLDGYSESYLRFVWNLAAGVTVTAYSLWAFEIASADPVNWQAISIAPFVMGLLRYAVDVDRGLAGEPEEAVLRDRVLLALALTWLAVFAAGVYRT